MYRHKIWRRFRPPTWVRRKSRTSPLRLSISSTAKARKRCSQGYNSLAEAAAAAARALEAAAVAPALEAAPASEAAGGAVALEAAAAVLGDGVGAVVGAAA